MFKITFYSKKIGGIRFIRLGRLVFSYSVKSNKARGRGEKRKIPLASPRAA